MWEAVNLSCEVFNTYSEVFWFRLGRISGVALCGKLAHALIIELLVDVPVLNLNRDNIGNYVYMYFWEMICENYKSN